MSWPALLFALASLDEHELIAEQQRGTLMTTASDAALELLRTGIDLRTTTREELENVPGLSPDDIEAILVSREATPALRPYLRASHVRLLTQLTASDTLAPPMLLNARVEGPMGLSAGVLITSTRLSIATPVLTHRTLASTGPGYFFHLPRAFVQWQTGRLRLIAGTFTVGFAERLTLDTTRRLTPNGFALSEDFRHPTELTRLCKVTECAQTLYVTPDFDVREAFRGLAASYEEARFSLFGFLSYQSRSVYQYELSDGSGAAPAVYLGQSETRVIFSTLPYFYDELTAGGHTTIALSERVSVGVTGYAAKAFTEFRFQSYSRHPPTGLYGSLGLDAHLRVESFAFHFEAARSFDVVAGGFGLIGRATWHTLELSLRYYDEGFSTPNARPISAPDEFDGQRARNELGARFTAKHALSPSWLLYGRFDVWVPPMTDPTVLNLYALARLEFTGSKLVQPGVWVEMRNRNLEVGDGADLYRAALRLELKPIGVVSQSLFTLSDNTLAFQQWLEAHGEPLEWFQWRVRSRYLRSLEQSWWSFIELAWLPKPGVRVAARYDTYVWLDTRPVTLNRNPNPEHRFTLDLRTTF